MQSQIRQRYGRAARVEEENGKRLTGNVIRGRRREKKKKKKRLYYFSQRFISHFIYEPPALL